MMEDHRNMKKFILYVSSSSTNSPKKLNVPNYNGGFYNVNNKTNLCNKFSKSNPCLLGNKYCCHCHCSCPCFYKKYYILSKRKKNKSHKEKETNEKCAEQIMTLNKQKQINYQNKRKKSLTQKN